MEHESEPGSQDLKLAREEVEQTILNISDADNVPLINRPFIPIVNI